MDDQLPLIAAVEQVRREAGDNVVEFRRREPEDGAVLEQLARIPSRGPCRHMKRRLIDAEQRLVHCGECGQVLDPIWCLLTLVQYREQLQRERQAIEAEKRRLVGRRQAAIDRRQRAEQRRTLAEAAAHCQVCEGTGWKPAGGHGVERCDCRKRLGARLL